MRHDCRQGMHKVNADGKCNHCSWKRAPEAPSPNPDDPRGFEGIVKEYCKTGCRLTQLVDIVGPVIGCNDCEVVKFGAWADKNYTFASLSIAVEFTLKKENRNAKD